MSSPAHACWMKTCEGVAAHRRLRRGDPRARPVDSWDRATAGASARSLASGVKHSRDPFLRRSADSTEEVHRIARPSCSILLLVPSTGHARALLMALSGAGPIALAACTAIFPFASGDDGGTVARDSGEPRRDASSDGAAEVDAGACAAPAVTTFDMSATAVARFGDYLLVGSDSGLDRWSGPALGTYCGRWPLDGGLVRSIWVNDQGATHVAMTGATMNNLAHADVSIDCAGPPSSFAFGGQGDYYDTVRDGDLYVAAGAAGVQQYRDPVGSTALQRTFVTEPPVAVSAITATRDWLFAAAPQYGTIVAIERSNGRVSSATVDGSEPNDLDSTSARLFVADGLWGLRTVSADASLELMETAPTPMSARRIAVDRGYAFVCGGDGATRGFLEAFDVTGVDLVDLYTVFDLADSCRGIAVDDTSVFLANGATLAVVPRACAVPAP